MTVIFFEVDGILNFEGSEAKAPNGVPGVADARVKLLKKKADELGAKTVLYGSWIKDWDFEDAKCSPNGVYLNKKMNRKGIHIMDKTRTPDGIQEWLDRHPNVDRHIILKAGDMND